MIDAIRWDLPQDRKNRLGFEVRYERDDLIHHLMVRVDLDSNGEYNHIRFVFDTRLEDEVKEVKEQRIKQFFEESALSRFISDVVYGVLKKVVEAKEDRYVPFFE